MHFLTRPITLVRTLITLAVLTTLTMGAGSIFARAASCTGPLHYKAVAGLMPQACGLDPAAPAPAGLASEIEAFADRLDAPTGSWPTVLQGMRSQGMLSDTLTVATDLAFDALNDRRLHRFVQVGSTITRLGSQPSGDYIEAISALDIDRDGDLDLALAGASGLLIYRQEGLTGTLSFTEPLRLSSERIDALAVGDFNGDLWPDLAAVAPQADKILAWRSSDTGLTPLALTITFPTDGFSALAAADFDNDGDDDLAALRGAGATAESVVIFHQTAIGFTLAYQLSPMTGGFLAHSLAAGDINGDGLADLAVTAGGNRPDAYLNLFLQGATGLNPLPTVRQTQHIPSAVLIADITHDGLADVLTLHDAWRTLTAFVQESSGDFSEQSESLPYSGRYRPNALAAVDLNGDGGLDVALVGRSGLSLFSNIAGAPVASFSDPAEASTIQGGPLTISGSTSAGTSAVEVRIPGLIGWTPALLSGTSWELTTTLPLPPRAYRIEARAISGERVQAPVAQRRVRVAPALLGVADNGQLATSPDRLVRIDPTTASVSPIGATGTNQIHALAFGADGRLYSANQEYLGTLDLSSGLFTPAANKLGVGDGPSGTWRFRNIVGLRLSPDGRLYAVERRGQVGKPDLLLIIDPLSGAYLPDAFGAGRDYALISGPGVPTDIDDIAFDEQGRLFAIGNENGRGGKLLLIDPMTGSASVANDFAVNNMEGMAFGPEGELLGSTGSSWAPTNDRLWHLDPTGGAATLIGPFSTERDIEALAFVPASINLPFPLKSLGQIAHFETAQTVSSPDAPLRGSADPDVAQLIIEASHYSVSANSWQSTSGATLSSTISAAELAAGLSLPLAEVPGVYYLTGWTINEAGTTAAQGQQTFINYLPEQAAIMADETHIFRYQLEAGEQLIAHLTSLEGDADLALWSSDREEQALLSNREVGDDALSYVAGADGMVQVEVHGYSSTVYRLTVNILAPDADAPLVAAGQSAFKAAPSTPMIDLASAPSPLRPWKPTATGYTIFVPLMRSN